MNCTASNHLVFTTSPNLTLRGDRSPKQLLFFFCKIPTPSPNGNIPQTYHTRQNSVCGRVHSPHFCSSQDPIEKKTHVITEIFVLFVFSLTLLCIRLLSNALLPDFPQRWRSLVAFSEEAEARVSAYPSHLWKAIVAYEDRRFFSHFGVDPVGIARAALSLSALGGGSTITQQLVKNTCLKNERTFSRKIVEMVLALALERTISKWRILSLYMSKIYWGHGIYGVESASIFYFGKHPSLLCLGESALLAGIIPAPELRSPFRDCSRGKTFQARVLKRMVEFGFLDVETALLAVKQSLQPRINCPEYSDGILLQLSLPNKGLYWAKGKQGHVQLPIMEIWDWEKESKVWEVMEEMENWACRLSELKNNNFRLKLKGDESRCL
ncbi:penicillin-binding protein 1A-like isoform X1 [Vitis riparia]|uniref:penicillin-binding protein 1A-like isoform X1 n=1 Tax=Vitis riparia TaxID=96939 RepID=UPI00155B2D4B|nr:penicillin-binding protein 1A-like isoform X1 [Vitis riparia]